MSQSPDDDRTSNSQQLVGYRNGWSALSQLIGRGSSFSGYERNCCFLNTTQGRFADISAAAGLDLMDDGRAVALTDWDFDGKIDLWIANRTAPRVRFLRNQMPSTNRWISLRLRGVTCNRDGVGARVEIFLNESSNQPLIKTLHAGDGYLTQSSKSLHFGLGVADRVALIVVRWPGGEREEFGSHASNSHYELVQGSGVATKWSPTQRIDIQPMEIPIPRQESASRTWVQGKIPLPQSRFINEKGEPESIESFTGQPLLINLWSRTCTACIQELNDWTQAKEQIEATEASILALSIDELSDRDGRMSNGSQSLLKGIGFPFPSGAATDGLLQNLELVQRTLIELQQPLPVPSSFLLDRWGQIAAIYKGKVSPERFMKDLKLLTSTKQQQRDAAVPFPGRFASNVFPSNPLVIVNALELADRSDDAVEYLKRYCELALENRNQPQFGCDEQALFSSYASLVEKLLMRDRGQDAIHGCQQLLELAPQHATLHRKLAMILLTRGKAGRSVPHFQRALHETPNDPTLLYNLGIAKMSLKKIDEAIEHFSLALRNAPQDSATHFHLANAYQMTQRTSDAIEQFRLALKFNPKSPYAANNLAWIYSTSKDPQHRNGAEAVRLAKTACQASRHRDPTMLTTLAAAYAEIQEFDEAIRISQAAISIAEKNGKTELAHRLRQRLANYSNHEPWRE